MGASCRRYQTSPIPGLKLLLELEIGDAVHPILGRAVCVGSEGRGWISRVLMHAGGEEGNIQRASKKVFLLETKLVRDTKIPKGVVRHAMQIRKCE